ncbi:MAG: outer membrane protein assembly factor BamE [Neisseriaceae bacterium]|nr:outer membrane protein assembly factor BamE [Neisseriaceae bacterium]MBR5675509.1 outer membrane protein assembly factor BamE [Neisseriaceae bacterium]
MKKFLLIVLPVLALNACSSERISHFPSYKLEVPQGNVVDEERLAMLSQGMTRAQVQMLLGTPLLQDPFHQNRWDYPYAMSRNGIIKERSTLSLYFDGDILQRIEKGGNNE